jgi:methyltransferase (TIGR00027 family)
VRCCHPSSNGRLHRRNGAQSPRRPRVQAPKGRHIPAQGGDAKRATNIRIALCVKGGGGWRAFFARRAAGTLGYRTQKRESPEGATYRAATIGRPFRALFPLPLALIGSVRMLHSCVEDCFRMTKVSEPAPLGEPLSVFGPREGFSPQIGIFVSQLNWMRHKVLSRLKNLSQEDLDWLPDERSNSIGTLLLHLAASDVYYGLNTFDGLPWARYPEEVVNRWEPAMKLGDLGRNWIRGNDLSFYLSALTETREHTLSEFRRRDDEWFMAVDLKWGWGPTNNFCKWFHVCEHESHHIGQIDLLIKQLPSRNVVPNQDVREDSIVAGKASRTALGVAIRRASHQVHDSSPLVLNDPIAVPILGEVYRAALEAAAESIGKESSIAMRALLVARNRLAEDKLAEAVSRGVKQYVLLGAGLDTFAHRNPHQNLRVFEVDHPATQQWKRNLVASSGLREPSTLRYVPVDFERQQVSVQLEESGLDLSAPTIFAWLGVVIYLTRPAFRSTLAFIASFPHGSGVVFDYALPRHALPSAELYARDELASRVESIGEPFRLFFTPSEIRQELSAFQLIEDFDAPMLNERYFSNRSDGFSLRGRSANIVCAWR